MRPDFPNNEQLYRAVRPQGMYVKPDGSFSSAAFSQRKGEGLSVTRGDFRSDAEVVSFMHKTLGFEGCAAVVTVERCRERNAVPKYLPTEDNSYHSEIHGSETKIPLTAGQQKHLARCSRRVDFED